MKGIKLLRRYNQKKLFLRKSLDKNFSHWNSVMVRQTDAQNEGWLVNLLCKLNDFEILCVTDPYFALGSWCVHLCKIRISEVFFISHHLKWNQHLYYTHSTISMVVLKISFIGNLTPIFVDIMLLLMLFKGDRMNWMKTTLGLFL